MCSWGQDLRSVLWIYKNGGNLTYSRHQWRFPWERLIATMLSLFNVSLIFSRKTCLWDIWAAISRKHIWNIILWKVAMRLPWAIFWKYLLKLTLHFGSRACLAPNVHSLCSSLPETGEVNVSLPRAQTPELHHSASPLDWETQGLYGPWGFSHWAIAFPQGNLAAARAHGSLNFMRGHDSHSPGCRVWHSQRRWSLTESSLPNSLWRKSALSPSASLPEECPATTSSQMMAWDDTCHPSFWVQYRSTHALPRVSVLFMCLTLFSVYHHPLLSLLHKSWLISDSSRTLASHCSPQPFSPFLILRSTYLH